ncbi:MAG: hypothetical protein KKD35_05430 [Elusimicrobia bacterium]|nr:hypothetical protein [Elusimicrobiota bacterium]
MKSIDKKLFQQELTKDFTYKFDVKSRGLYLVEITASCKNWRQNALSLRSFFRDDDLAIKIDNQTFPKLSGKRGLFDGEASWNGNKLKGLEQTNLFFLHFNKGEHTAELLVKGKPKPKFIKVYKVDKKDKYIPSNNPAQSGNRRPWLTFAFRNIGLKKLEIEASAQQGKWFSLFKRDDSDIKLIIDGEIQKNKEPKTHKYWYWCGKTLKGKNKTFDKELNLSKEPHYIELWANRTPETKSINLELEGEDGYNKSDIQSYSYKGISGKEDYNGFDDDILYAVNYWNKEFLSQKYPPPEPLDANLVKAMIYIESRMGYFNPSAGYPDVMQVGGDRNSAMKSMLGEKDYPANEFISEKKYGHMSYNFKGKKPQVLKPAESIFWGVRWLYYKAQYLPDENKPYKREWHSWNKAVQLYNGGGNKNYEKEVYDIYKKGADGRKRPIIKLFISIFALLGILTAGSVLAYTIHDNQGRTWLSFDESLDKEALYELNINKVVGLEVNKTLISTMHEHGWDYYTLPKEGNPYIDWRDVLGDEAVTLIVRGNTVVEEYETHYVLKETKKGFDIIYNLPHEFGDSDLRPAFYGDWVEFIDIDGDKIYEVRESVFIPYSNASNAIWSDWYRYNKEKGIYEFFKREVIDEEEHDLGDLVEPAEKKGRWLIQRY